MNAAGSYVPPFLIFKSKRMVDILLRGSPPGNVGACSDNGWITNEIFVKWLSHFIAHVRPTVSNREVMGMRVLKSVRKLRDKSPTGTHYIANIINNIYYIYVRKVDAQGINIKWRAWSQARLAMGPTVVGAVQRIDIKWLAMGPAGSS